jgi:t-SNARE complex subunit (syntaxin)
LRYQQDDEMKVKITDTQYVRDINSKAILNTNRAQLDEYHVKKNMMSKVNEINTLKEEVAEIKDMMQKILTLVSERK